MGIFSRNKNSGVVASPGITSGTQGGAEQMLLASMVLDSISEGVIIVDAQNIVRMINPAALTMLGYNTPDAVMNVNVAGLLTFENSEGVKIEDSANEVFAALAKNQEFTTRSYVLVNVLQQKKAVAVTITLSKTGRGEKIISLRDIAKELEEEGEQAEFISTASHEMRTPVASIEGYLGLALNPQCATIDDRARKYLEEAHASSQHLGRLFKDLLDVTKLDDKKAKVHLVPTEVNSLVREIVSGQIPMMGQKNIKFTFGANDGIDGSTSGIRTIDQVSYALVDVDFMREIINNLVENAIKYTKEGGAIWVNVRGDGDRVLINVTDTGIGISPDDLKHIFQKFYRVDNSQTREIGGTGLGLYIVKMRAEAMGGKIWAESSFGEGSTFYLSLPRLTFEEYERRKQIIANTEMMSVNSAQTQAQTPGQQITTPMQPAIPPVQPTVIPAQPVQPIQPGIPGQM
jgi:signal transduction histidine kinase